MKLLHQCLALGVIASLATSCSQEAPWRVTGEEGRISLKLQTDFSVATSTRANDAESPVKPDGERFKIKLENADGSYSKEWENLNKFNDEEGFPRGQYTITASYGSEDEQGFNNPYFVGTESISVLPGETVSQSLTASLANSMVSVRYTDSFISYFSNYNYNAALVTEGISQPVLFARSETRPAYVKSGEVTVNFDLTDPSGNNVTISPATFLAQPRHHYVITVNVKGGENNGDQYLDVEFTEDVTHDSEEILLTDDLFTSPAPEITIEGFEQNGTIELFESVNLDKKPEFQVVAFGGIKNAKFTVEVLDNDGVLPGFGGEVDLTTADPIAQAWIKESGLKCYGFAKPSGDEQLGSMAVVDMKDFVENLSPGEYKISLCVKDALGRINPMEAKTRADGEEENPISFNVKVNKVVFDLNEDVAPRFMSDELSVIISTNYPGAKDEISFQTENRGGDMIDAKVISVEEVESSDPATYSFRYVLSTDNIDDVDWQVKAFYPKKDPLTLSLIPYIPNYSVEVDPFANKLMLKVIPEDPNDLAWMMDQIKFYFKNNGTNQRITDGDTRDLKSGIITIENSEKDPMRFVPGTEYSNFFVSFGNKENDQDKQLSFKTEDSIPVPNGDFEDLVETINTKIDQGGQWTQSRGGAKHQTTLTMKVSEPVHWKSSNAITCNTGAATINSWFTVPSVYNTSLEWVTHQPEAKILGIGQSPYDFTPIIYDSNKIAAKGQNAVVIRNVAWADNGVVPGLDNKTGNTDKDEWGHSYTNYYCSNIPSIANRSRGFLILGDGDRDGVDFASRPSILKGQYKYLPDDNDRNENGVIVVNVLSGDQVIGTGEFKFYEEATYKEFECPITYVSDIYNRKATSIQIHIYSSNKESDIVTTDYCNKYECCSRGASLFVDALEFGY